MTTVKAPDIQLEDMKEKSVVGIRFHTTGAELPANLQKTYARVLEYLTNHSAKPDCAYCIYYDMAAEPWDIEAGFVVHQIVARHDDIEFGTLPGGRMATLWHIGPYNTLNDSWIALDAYIKEHRLRPNKVMWELYTTDPATEPDPAKQRTLLVWPVE